jgi:cation:H+ antiporter
MLLSLGFILAGLVLLVKGADWLVEGSSTIARKIGASELMIGLTVVAFGTSMPELTVNIISSFQGASDIAIGNIIGSNIANILLILGITASIKNIHVQNSTVWKEIPLSLLGAGLLLIMANDSIVDSYPLSELSRSDGLAFIAFFIIFLWYTFGLAKNMNGNAEVEGKKKSVLLSIGMLLLGMGMLVLGGKLTVDGAVNIATLFGVSQAVIGLTVVAIGTSLPELATAIVAALKGKSDIAVGNIVGSNIFNIFWILGISAVIHPLSFAPAMNTDIIIMIIATIVLFFAVHTGYPHKRLRFWKQKENHVIERLDGVLMLAMYATYIGYAIWRG